MSVYFARVRGYVKIGYSADPTSRVQTITTGSCIKPADVSYGDDVDLFGWIPGDRKTEKAMHQRFAHLRVVGEWFWDDDAYESVIEAHECGVPFGLPSGVVLLMRQYPAIPRADVIAIYEQDRADKLADPDSTLSQIRSMIGGRVFDEGMEDRAVDRRAKDRAYWRAQRAEQKSA